MTSFLQLSFAILSVFASLLASQASAFTDEPARVLKCRTIPEKERQVCVIDAKDFRVGQKVVVSSEQHHYIGNGQLKKIKGDKAIVTFQKTKTPIQKDYIVQSTAPSDQAVDWSYAFSKPN